MDDHQIQLSLSFLWITGLSIVVFGLSVGWLLGCGFTKRQRTAASPTPSPAGGPTGTGRDPVKDAPASESSHDARGGGWIRACDPVKDAPASESSPIPSDLLAVVNHGIRTPLNGVIGYTDLLLETPLLADQRELAMNVRQSSEVLVALLNDISDYARLQHGNLTITSTPFDLGDTVVGVMELLAARANEKSLEFVHDITLDGNRRAKGDPARTRQVLLNLIGNALKFTAEGHVVVRVEVLPSAPDYVRCVISDTGCGIPAHSQASLLEKSAVIKEGIALRSNGQGVGLAICRRLVELMGGQIGLSSRPGKGSDFWFQLPLAADETGAIHAADAPAVPYENIRVLVIEPSIFSRKMLVTHLTSAGFAVEALTSGQEALARLRQRANDRRPFQCVVFTERLPDQSGRSFVLAVRIDPILRLAGLVCLRRYGVRSTTGLTGLGVIEVAKPALRSAPLVYAVRSAPLMRPSEEAIAAAAVPGGDGKGTQDATDKSGTGVFTPIGFALLAEDNELNQRLMFEMLRSIGWACKVAENGAEAVRLASIRRYDLILMDCHMAEMDGFEASRQIRKAEVEGGAARTPIVAVTADTVAESRKRCLAAGMDDCLTKPFRRTELEAMLQRWAPRGRNVSPAA